MKLAPWYTKSTCAEARLDHGFNCAQETAQVMVNLRRFYDRSSRRMVQA